MSLAEFNATRQELIQWVSNLNDTGLLIFLNSIIGCPKQRPTKIGGMNCLMMIRSTSDKASKTLMMGRLILPINIDETYGR